jgi:outer membrane lipopolysaccharide assembly protein LptE/RlpB
MNLIVSDFLSKLEFGEVHPLRNGTCNPAADQRSIISNGVKVFNNMAIFPLFTSINYSPEYLTLKGALEKNLLTITEVSQGGSVPELKVLNRGGSQSFFSMVKSLQGQSRTGF